MISRQIRHISTPRAPRKAAPPRPAVLSRGISVEDARSLLDRGYEATAGGADEARPDLVIVSGAEWERLTDQLDERHAIAAHAATRGEETVPHAMAKRLADGENRIKVWREHRGMTLAQLGEAIGKGRAYLSEIEAGKKGGTIETLRAIAAALRVDLDDIT